MLCESSPPLCALHTKVHCGVQLFSFTAMALLTSRECVSPVPSCHGHI